MIKLFYRATRMVLRQRGGGAAESGAGVMRWACDPLAHPAIAAMSASELADLPTAQLRSCCRE